MSDKFENYYIFDKWNNFLKYFEFNNSLFITNIGFEERSTSSLMALTDLIHKSLDKIRFLIFNVAFQNRIKKQYENLGIEFETPIIEKKTEENIKKIKIIKERKNLNLDFFEFCIEDDNGSIIGFDQIFNQIKNEIEKRKYNFFFLDISSFPRSIFIPLIKILYNFSKIINLYIIWTNKGGITFERNVLNYDQALTLPRFSHFDPDSDDIIFWLPILNYDPNTIDLVLNQRRFKKNTFYFPLVTFPTIWPDETNNILMKNKDFFLNRKFDIEKVLYVPYNNPFEFYLRILDFYKAKKSIYGNNFFLILSPFGTKAQSLGVCLCALFLEKVSILICRPVQYQEDDKNIPEEDIGKSYIALIKGDLI